MLRKKFAYSLALLLTLSGIGISTSAEAAEYVHQNGQVYVTNWDNYDYFNSPEFDNVTLEDFRGNKPIFSQNRDYDWVTSPLIVKGDGIFGFSFYSENVKVYDYDTREEITNGLLRAGQRIYIVSKDDPTNITLTIGKTFVIEN